MFSTHFTPRSLPSSKEPHDWKTGHNGQVLSKRTTSQPFTPRKAKSAQPWPTGKTFLELFMKDVIFISIGFEGTESINAAHAQKLQTPFRRSPPKGTAYAIKPVSCRDFAR
jgi:hypothetical protein